MSACAEPSSSRRDQERRRFADQPGRPEAAAQQLLRPVHGRGRAALRCRPRRTERRRVELAAKRVGHRKHRLARARDAARPHQQRRRRPDWKVSSARQRLRHRGPDPEPGEAARSVADRQAGDGREPDAGIPQQRVDRGQKLRGMSARADDAHARRHRRGRRPDRDRRSVGGRLDGQPHQSASSPRRDGVGKMMQPESPSGLRQPGARALRPLDQDRVALGHQSLPVEIGGFVGGAKAIAVEVEHRTAPPAIAVDERVRRARSLARHAEPARDGLDEGGLSGAQIALEGEQRLRAATTGPAFRLPRSSWASVSSRITRGGGAWAPAPRRTSGAPMALRSLSWSRSIAASSNSRLAAASRICRSSDWISGRAARGIVEVHHVLRRQLAARAARCAHRPRGWRAGPPPWT